MFSFVSPQREADRYVQCLTPVVLSVQAQRLHFPDTLWELALRRKQLRYVPGQSLWTGGRLFSRTL
jgi:hypothetical protein